MKFPNPKNYILLPQDLLVLGKRLLTWLHYTDYLGLLALIIFIFLANYLPLPPEPIFFTAFILAIIYWNLDSRISIALALACLVTIPVLLTLFNRNIILLGEVWAEQVAVWAYYFLVIGVVRQIFEYRAEAKAEREGLENPKSKIQISNQIQNLKQNPKSKSFTRRSFSEGGLISNQVQNLKLSSKSKIQISNQIQNLKSKSSSVIPAKAGTKVRRKNGVVVF